MYTAIMAADAKGLVHEVLVRPGYDSLAVDARIAMTARGRTGCGKSATGFTGVLVSGASRFCDECPRHLDHRAGQHVEFHPGCPECDTIRASGRVR